MRISIIVAKTDNDVIGSHDQLPWHLPQDLQHFKRTTLGHHVIMGRRTFASLPKPLPGRSLIVITRQPHYQAQGCQVAQSLSAALALARQAGETEVFVAGGGEIYRAALALAHKLYVTEIKTQLVGDTFFPTLLPGAWREVRRIHHPADAQHPYAYAFVELVRAH